VGSVVSGVGLYIAADAGNARREAREASSRTATATVVESGRTRGENRRRYLVYRYEAGGQTYPGRVTLRNRDRRPGEPGATLEVRYLPSEPGRSWVPGYEPRGVPIVLVFVVPPVLSLSAWALWWMVRRQRRLVEEGRPAEARVIASKKLNAGHGDYFRLEYEFRTLSGSRRVVKKDSTKNLPIGTSVTMIYDRDNPNRSAVYPLSMVRAKRSHA
jgi:hypothetical protein